MFTRYLDRFAERRWHRRFDQAHALELGAPTRPESLRLILGVGRSGTSWVSGVLSQSATPLRFLSEPLFLVRPRLNLSKGWDQTSIPYQPILSEGHRLLRVYNTLTGRLGQDVQCRVRRDDSDWQLCLIKEVHSLTASEALLHHFACPTIFILRDPVRIIDSIFCAQELDSIYLRNESRYVTEGGFLDRFVPAAIHRNVLSALRGVSGHRGERERIIQSAVLAAGLLQLMMIRLGHEISCATVFRYEEFCTSPHELFADAARSLGLLWSGAAVEYLTRTMQGNIEAASNPYSIVRNTASSLDRPLRYLTANEADACYGLLLDSGITPLLNAAEPAASTGTAIAV